MERVIGQGGFGKVQAAVKQSGPDADQWYGVSSFDIGCNPGCSLPLCNFGRYAVKVLSKAFVLSTSSGTDSVFTELRALVELDNVFICNSHYAFQVSLLAHVQQLDAPCSRRHLTEYFGLIQQDEFFLYLVLDLALGGDLRCERHELRKCVDEIHGGENEVLRWAARARAGLSASARVSKMQPLCLERGYEKVSAKVSSPAPGQGTCTEISSRTTSSWSARDTSS
eukprot:scaffold2771_cov252-Pinguiococcus_pyrenoidosus.AAC.10